MKSEIILLGIAVYIALAIWAGNWFIAAEENQSKAIRKQVKPFKYWTMRCA
jgi:hypothetical protein